MEKNITWSNDTTVYQRVQNTAQALKQARQKWLTRLMTPMEWLRKYYSDILERHITMRHTLLLVNVQLAFILAALPADYPLWARLACCTWLLLALKQVKDEEGKKAGSMEREA